MQRSLDTLASTVENIKLKDHTNLAFSAGQAGGASQPPPLPSGGGAPDHASPQSRPPSSDGSSDSGGGDDPHLQDIEHELAYQKVRHLNEMQQLQSQRQDSEMEHQSELKRRLHEKQQLINKLQENIDHINGMDYDLQPEEVFRRFHLLQQKHAMLAESNRIIQQLHGKMQQVRARKRPPRATNPLVATQKVHKKRGIRRVRGVDAGAGEGPSDIMYTNPLYNTRD